MAVFLGLLLFTLPFIIYGLWWFLSKNEEAFSPPVWVLVLGAIGLVGMIGGSLYYGLSRSIDRTIAYEPARFEPVTDRPVAPAQPRPRPQAAE